MIRPILLIHRAGWGGAEQTLLDLIEGLPTDQWQVTAAVPDGPFSEKLAGLQTNIESIRFPAWRKMRDLIRNRLCLRSITRLAGRVSARVVIAGDFRTAPYAVQAAVNRGCPSLVFIQDSTIRQRHIKAYRVHRADRVLCPSNRQIQQAILGGVDPSRAILLPVGIDTKRFNPRVDGSQLRNQWMPCQDAVLVGCIGSISPLKGQDLLLEAMLPLMREDKRIGLVFAGLGKNSFIENLKGQAPEFLSSNRIRFVDWMEDIGAAYAAVDVVAVPSRSESFSRVTAEAMACGKAVITTQTGAVEELFDRDRCGISVPVGDISALREALSRLVNDAELRMQLGHAASEQIVHHFSLAKSQQQFQEVLQSLCD